MVHKLASAIYNDIMSGLAGITSTPSMSIDQLEDDIVDERLQIIKEYSLKNLIPSSVEDFLKEVKALRTIMPKGRERMEFLDKKAKDYIKSWSKDS